MTAMTWVKAWNEHPHDCIQIYDGQFLVSSKINLFK